MTAWMDHARLRRAQTTFVAGSKKPGEEAGASGASAPPSYIEVEVSPLGLSVFERSGDGKTAALLQLLAKYGLRLEEKVSSPCG